LNFILRAFAIERATFRSTRSFIRLDSDLRECTVELLEASWDDLCKRLDTQPRTYLSSDLIVDLLLNR